MSSDIKITLGTEMHIAPEVPATYDEAGYGAITSYVEVGQVASIPTFGGSAEVPTFTPLKSGVVNKRKGSINYGAPTIPFASVLSDAGQQALQEGFDGAERNTVHSFKLVNSEIGTVYFTGMVSGFQYNYGDANSINQSEATIEIVTQPVVVEPV